MDYIEETLRRQERLWMAGLLGKAPDTETFEPGQETPKTKWERLMDGAPQAAAGAAAAADRAASAAGGSRETLRPAQRAPQREFLQMHKEGNVPPGAEEGMAAAELLQQGAQWEKLGAARETAAALSLAFERDARRYDSGFALY